MTKAESDVPGWYKLVEPGDRLNVEATKVGVVRAVAARVRVQ
jgi:hypothetical protein